MASPVPAKSQPLHNFDFPRKLDWKTDTNSNTSHHRRRSIKSPNNNNNNPSPVRHDSPSTRSGSVTRSPTRSDPVIKNNSNNQSKIQTFVKGSKSERSKNKDLGEIKKSSKILIKIGKNTSTNDDNDGVVKVKQEEGKEKERCVVKKEVVDEVNDEFVDEEAKTWNLRPRKPIRKSLNVNGSGINVKNSIGNVNVVDKSGKVQVQSPVRNTNKLGENEEKEKRRHCLDVCLTKEEIEEDIYAFTGLKPSRRPKKRAKQVQKQVDFVFPGLWLMSITPDSYKVSENSMKG